MNGRLREVLAWLEARGSRRNVDGMKRYGIVAARAFGVSMGTMRALAKKIGKDHELAQSLWESGWHEGRMMAVLVEDPGQVTRGQMDAWARTFENWADCDTACFALFDRTPHAWDKARQWSGSTREFVKRGGFALMASLALHAKDAPDVRFHAMLPLIEEGARDERNFVKKGVSWALRSIGHRNLALNTAALELAKRLAAAAEPGPRWVGRDALRDLTRPKLQAKLVRRAGTGAKLAR